MYEFSDKIYNIIKNMLHTNDIKRVKGDEVYKLECLAKACSRAQSNEFKDLWFTKLVELGKKYNKMNVVRRLIH
tara:strand:- start:89 stop:310 length:222 start_codon:yes stop_codon:yes gene_type:complete